ncbi:CU044_5270 family protein [Amycolatopsis taiwanensis]|uniref:CU044_5270 family protein n=1 Tax=Amycolatopsis taiwanensis TaxID=342230 RepID=UPI0004886BEA|nr:CU044_5270 family protein [Amycolatopsis taiwanensis]
MTEHDNSMAGGRDGGMDPVRVVWTEGELDAALAELPGPPSSGQPLDPALRTARARLGEALARETVVTRKQRGFRRSLVAAAAVIAVAAAAIVIGNPLTGGTPPAAAAAQTLRQAAGATITERDAPWGPGQYRYVAERTWGVAQVEAEDGRHLAWLDESVTRTWIPRDETQDWVRDNEKTGKRKWVVGSAEQAASTGTDTNQFGPPDGRISAPCGDFDGVLSNREPSCAQAGHWKEPTSAWLATLPRDPNALLTALDDGVSDDQGEIALQRSAMLLSSGLVPADLRAAIYQALALLPELRVTEQLANLDGRQGIALGVTSGGRRRDIIIDPETGQFVGQRMIQVDDEPGGLPAGTLITSTSVTNSVVDVVG